MQVGVKIPKVLGSTRQNTKFSCVQITRLLLGIGADNKKTKNNSCQEKLLHSRKINDISLPVHRFYSLTSQNVFSYAGTVNSCDPVPMTIYCARFAENYFRLILPGRHQIFRVGRRVAHFYQQFPFLNPVHKENFPPFLLSRMK